MPLEFEKDPGTGNVAVRIANVLKSTDAEVVKSLAESCGERAKEFLEWSAATAEQQDWLQKAHVAHRTILSVLVKLDAHMRGAHTDDSNVLTMSTEVAVQALVMATWMLRLTAEAVDEIKRTKEA